MEVKEPMVSYNTQPSANVLRNKIVSRLEREEDTHVLQLLYSFIEHLQRTATSTPKYSMESLNGILSGGLADEVSYEDLKKQHLKNIYAL